MPAMPISQLLDQAARRTTRIAPGAQAIPATRRRRIRGSSVSVPSPLRATARSFARSKRGNDILTVQLDFTTPPEGFPVAIGLAATFVAALSRQLLWAPPSPATRVGTLSRA